MIDTHAHLDHLDDWKASLRRARQQGVSAVLAMSMDLESCRTNLAIAREADFPVYLAMGMHPSEADLKALPACLALIRENLDQIAAIGEVGLDFWYKWVKKDPAKQEEQRRVFQAFLDLSKETGLPVVIHSRGAWAEALEMVRRSGVTKAEFHWYSGPLDVLKEIVEAGYYVSATPSLAYSAPSREAIIRVPLRQMLIETDSPVTYRNKQTGEVFQAEPADVRRTLEAYCALTGLAKEPTLVALDQNARTFFNLKEEDGRVCANDGQRDP